MADDSARSIALMSIHPRHARAILRGSKSVEFRRSVYPGDATHVVVYATAPVQRVVGWFSIAHVEKAAPAALWQRYGAVGCVTADEFEAYYVDCPRGAAIEIGEVTELAEPLPLIAFGPDLSPPQSYRYLPASVLEVLRSLVVGKTRKSSVAGSPA